MKIGEYDKGGRDSGRILLILVAWLTALGLGGCADRPEEAARATARRYVAYVSEGKWERLPALYMPGLRPAMEGAAEAGAGTVYDKLGISIELEEVRKAGAGYYGIVTASYEKDGARVERSATLYLTAEGQIKYDPVLLMHPGVGIPQMIAALRSDHPELRKGTIETLERFGVPGSGYDPDAPEASREAAIEQIEAWWAANLDKYDYGEPKLPLSPEDRATMRELGGAGTAAMP